MFDLESCRAAVARDLGATLERLASVADGGWDNATRCEGWRVRDLVGHMVAAAGAQTEALGRVRDGNAEPTALPVPAPGSGGELLSALTARREQLLEALAELPDAAMEAGTPLPFGLVPTPVALQIVALEYGFHRNDIEWALGSPLPLQPDIAATLLEVMPGLLPIFAAGSGVAAPGDSPEIPTSYLLRAGDFTLAAVHRDGSWELAEDTVPVDCEIVAPDPSSLALFVMGRIPAEHTSLKVSGDPAVAAAFKRYFPGP